jgi:hypothetical protein
MKVNTTFKGKIESTTCVSKSQMGTNNLWDLFWEKIILPLKFDFCLNNVNNGNKQHPIIWHSL